MQKKINRNRNRKTRRNRRSKTRRSNRNRTHKQRGGAAGCAGEYALVQGIKIPAAADTDSSFSGLNIDNAMGKLYDPKCGSMPTEMPGPVYKL
jgi:hypothetical protein